MLNVIRYMEGALVPETANESHYVADVTTGRRKDYVPSSEPGSRLPHMKIMVLDNILNRVCYLEELFRWFNKLLTSMY